MEFVSSKIWGIPPKYCYRTLSELEFGNYLAINIVKQP